jgi:hypothetical protein
MEGILGIIIGAAIIIGLVAAIGFMSRMGADANKNFCDGDCGSCMSQLEDDINACREKNKVKSDAEK